MQDVLLSFRMACCRDVEMKSFLTQAENLLFNYRVSCMTADELLRAVKPLRKLIHSYESSHEPNLSIFTQQVKDIHQFVLCITRNMTWDSLIAKYAGGVTHEFVFVPFQFVSDLVAKRRVVIKNGYAKIPCTKLHDILNVLFKNLFQYGMEQARKSLSEVKDDIRILNLFRRLKVSRINFVCPIGSNKSVVWLL